MLHFWLRLRRNYEYHNQFIFSSIQLCFCSLSKQICSRRVLKSNKLNVATLAEAQRWPPVYETQ